MSQYASVVVIGIDSTIKIFRDLVKEYILKKTDDRLTDLATKQKEKEQSSEIKKVLEIDPELWNFLDDYKEPLSKVIEDWDVYRSVGQSANIPYNISSDELKSPSDVLDTEYEAFMKGEISERDFWDSGRKDNLREILSMLQNNADKYQLSDVDLERIRRLLSIIPSKLQELDATYDETDKVRIRRDLPKYYQEALFILKDIASRDRRREDIITRDKSPLKRAKNKK